MSEFIFNSQAKRWFSFDLIAYACEIRIDQFNDSLFERYEVQFHPSLAQAVPKRRGEFLAGRYCAADALSELGYNNVAIEIGENRCPIWPKGVVGTISHSDTMAVAMVASENDYLGVGIDIEKITSENLVDDIMSHVITPCELEVLLSAESPAELTRESLFTIAFSIKESFFKAVYPGVGYYFDFSSVSITEINPINGELLLRINQTLSDSFQLDDVVRGEFSLIDEDFVATAIALPR